MRPNRANNLLISDREQPLSAVIGEIEAIDPWLYMSSLQIVMLPVTWLVTAIASSLPKKKNQWYVYDEPTEERRRSENYWFRKAVDRVIQEAKHHCMTRTQQVEDDVA